ncbi:MAG: FxsA family protein [Proteobacteria bacterium]|nr:FxsA family protein [Pseudomonadota bacterium]MBS0573254.1 FxsA family protein [Pseudomonadota bacterium]
MWILVLFIVVPMIEIALFIKVGGLIGLWPTLGLIVALALLGSWLVRTQGLRAFADLQLALETGGNPSPALLHGVMIFFGGLLLMVPGFFTDALGLLLLVRPVRSLAIRALGARLGPILTGRPGRGGPRPPRDGGDVVEGTFTDLDPADPPPRRPGPPSGWTRH